MKTTLLRFSIIFFNVFCCSTLLAKGQDSIQYYFSFNYFKDLSDTFGGGTLLSGEFTLSKSFYGAGISYGHFQSHSSFIYQITIEEENKTFEVPFDELAIMQTGSLFGSITPIKKNRIQFDLLLGMVLGKSESLCFKSISYTYDQENKILTSVEKDYQMIERNHFGYQAGFNISYYAFTKIGLQISLRLHDLSNGGTFFFLGGGICFRPNK